uniref:Vitellogenin domain-containing protein n=1 Tax=Panagrolaimus superbus TaxID=310955 RepID=A0A914Z3W4_9BILA
MIVFFLFLILFQVAYCENIEDKPIPDLPYSAQPPPSTGKTRLLLYEYDLHSKTIIHDPRAPEGSGIIHEMKARYNYEMLHHDLGGNILSRYQIIECITGPCQNVPDFYVYMVQGGQNLLSVYAKVEDETVKPDWGATSALAYAIASPAQSGEGDEQLVVMPHGYCQQFFGRPEDKTFTRKIDQCDFGGAQNHTLLSGLTTFDYQQFVEYKQNKKIDADIVFTEADEQFIIQSPLDDRLALRINSHLSLEMMNRTLRIMNRYCPHNISGDDCARQIFGATILGKNWLDINKKLASLSSTTTENNLSNFLNNEQNNLKACTKPEKCFELFKKLTNVIRISTPEEIEKELEKKNLDAGLILFLNAIATAGSPKTWKKAIVVATKHGGEHLAQNFIDSLAFTTIPTASGIKAIMKDFTTDKQLKYYSTLGYLINRRCKETPSKRNACNLQKDAYLNVLLKNEMGATVEELSEALWHFDLKAAAEFFKQFLCSTHPSNFVNRALSFYQKLGTSHFDRQINMKLLSIFRNTCPKSVSTQQSISAMNTLVRIAPDFQTMGSFILRGETNNPTDNNLWAQFYERINQFVINGAYKYENYWRTLRDLKPFRPNYLQRSLGHDSSSYWINVQNFSLPLTLTGSILPSESYLNTHLSLKNNISLINLEIHDDQSRINLLGYPMEAHNLHQTSYLYEFSQNIRLLSGLTLDLHISVIYGIKNNGEQNKASFSQGLELGVKAAIGNANEHFGQAEYFSTITGDFSSNVINKSCQYLSFDNVYKTLKFTQSSSTKKVEEKTKNEKIQDSSINLGKFVNHQCNSVAV